MQVVKGLLLFLIILPLASIFFAPKKEIYYMLEHKLSAQKIVITETKITENTLGLSIEDAIVYIDGAVVATVEKIDIMSMFYYTKLDISGLKVAEGLPTELILDRADIRHIILSLFEFEMVGESNLGEMSGNIYLRDQNISIDFGKENINKSLVRQLQLRKIEKGWRYESKF